MATVGAYSDQGTIVLRRDFRPTLIPRCSACPGKHPPVPGKGPSNAKIMIVYDRPNGTDTKHKAPMKGQAGDELDQTYLRLAGLYRNDIYITPMVKCWHEREYQDVRPSVATLESCAVEHLCSEILTVDPEYLILAGADVCKLAGLNLNVEHGMPTYVTDYEKLYGYTGWLIPMYAPGLGLRETKYMIYLLDDWAKLGRAMCGNFKYPHLHAEKIPQNYRLLTTCEEIEESLEDRTETYEHLALDTETDENAPFSIQYSTKPGVAYMFLVEADLVSTFKLCLERFWQNKLTVHFAENDLEDLHRLGIEIQSVDVVDTMRELYHLANQPQGLKAAVYRNLGYRMTTYIDTVEPYSRKALLQWIETAIQHVQDCWFYTEHKQLKTKVKVIHKPHESLAVLRRIERKLHEEGSEYDPWQQPKFHGSEMKPRLFGRPWLSSLENDIGRMPRRSIVHVPIEEAVTYGCSDADFTGRLAVWLAEERKRIVKQEWKVE